MPSNVEFKQGDLAPTRIQELLWGVTLVIGGSIAIAIASKIYVPFYPVHMTLQTLAVMALAAAYGSRLGVATVLAYFIEGALGLPVFTSTPPDMSGPLYFMGPTAGFLVGFLVLAATIGLAADRGWRASMPKLLGAVVAGQLATFGLGFAWLAWGMPLPTGNFGIGPQLAYAGAVAPFLISEAFKIGLVVVGAPVVTKGLQRLLAR